MDTVGNQPTFRTNTEDKSSSVPVGCAWSWTSPMVETSALPSRNVPRVVNSSKNPPWLGSETLVELVGSWELGETLFFCFMDFNMIFNGQKTHPKLSYQKWGVFVVFLQMRLDCSPNNTSSHTFLRFLLFLVGFFWRVQSAPS